MRPDRIVVGEVRGAEAFDMLQAMNTGHTGSMSTIHANSAGDALHRLEAMVLMAGTGLPIPAVRRQIATAVHLVVHMTRDEDGTRCLQEVLRVRGLEADELVVAPAIAEPSEIAAGNGTRFRRGSDA
jgi:pilus assembly protein CpaF